MGLYVVQTHICWYILITKENIFYYELYEMTEISSRPDGKTISKTKIQGDGCKNPVALNYAKITDVQITDAFFAPFIEKIIEMKAEDGTIYELIEYRKGTITARCPCAYG